MNENGGTNFVGGDDTVTTTSAAISLPTSESVTQNAEGCLDLEEMSTHKKLISSSVSAGGSALHSKADPSQDSAKASSLITSSSKTKGSTGSLTTTVNILPTESPPSTIPLVPLATSSSSSSSKSSAHTNSPPILSASTLPVIASQTSPLPSTTSTNITTKETSLAPSKLTSSPASCQKASPTTVTTPPIVASSIVPPKLGSLPICSTTAQRCNNQCNPMTTSITTSLPSVVSSDQLTPPVAPAIPTVITASTLQPLPPGVLDTPTTVGMMHPLPGALASSAKMPLPPEALSASQANNVPLPPGILGAGSALTKTSSIGSSGKFLDGIRPMTCVTQSTPKQHQQQHQYEGRQQNNVNVDHQPSPVLAKKEGEHIGADSSNFNDILAYLRKYSLADTESKLLEEIKKKEKSNNSCNSPATTMPTVSAETEVGNVLAKYRSDGDPNSYNDAYSDLLNFIEISLDQHKHELALILYPTFVHMYLELVYNQHESEAALFMEKYAPRQENYYQEDIKKLSYVKKREHMAGNELIDNFKTSLFTVRMSRDTYQQLRDHKKKNNGQHHTLLWNLIHDHLFLDMYEGHGRSKSQIDSTGGGVVGEAQRQANRAKVYYGLPREPDIQLPTNQEEEEEPDSVDGDKPKKKKKKDIFFNRKSKTDPNAPIATRMPFPDLRDSDKLEKAKALRESLKRANLGPNNIPSICMYTLMNVSSQVTALAVTDDSSMLAAGLSDSKIKVWSLLNHKLKRLKAATALQDINREAEDVLHRMMDDTTSECCKELVGHSGPVYAVSFSPDRTFLLSGSEDGVIRLWSMQTWTCLVLYKGHVYPVWDVQFSPLGYYFASCGHDRTARLWTTEQANPLRIFQGHFSDIDCLAFHPNSNYIGTGSSDRSVRLWDCVTGTCVRFMTGHKESVLLLSFSPDGRFIVSGSSDKKVLIWDIAFGHLIAELNYHTNVISGLGFSREGTILGTSSIDCTLALWDFGKLMSESCSDEVNVTQNPEVRSDTDSLLLGCYRTKSTPVLHLHFTRRNLLLAIGSFEPTM